MSHPCAHCGFENDPTRVYCHNCGEKLERAEEEASTALPGGFTPPQVQVAPRRKIMWGALFGLWAGRLYALVKMLVLAALVLMLVQAFRAPEDWPEPAMADATRAKRLTEVLNTAADSPGAVTFQFSADDVARWFVSSVKFKDPQWSFSLRPISTYAQLGDGVLNVGLETLFPIGEISVYFTAQYEPVRKSSGYILKPTRYTIGRLILPPFLGLPAQAQFKGLADALESPFSLLSKASDIQIQPDSVKVRWPGDKP